MLPTVATAVLSLLQVPPVAVSVKVIVVPVHIVPPPPIVPAVTDVPIVIPSVAVALPHAVVTVYMTVFAPELAGVSTPELLIVAVLLLTDHTPPVLPSVYVAVLPVHTIPGPVTVPASGKAFTVTVFVAVAVPQLPLIV